MYSNIDELPTQVRNSLSPEDQRHWMDIYNTHADKGAKEAREAAWRACMNRPSSFSFSAYASVDDWDIQGERIDIPALMKTMDRYIESGAPISWNHGNYQVGNCWGYERVKKDGMDGVKIYGNLFGGDDGVYDEVRKKFLRGARGFSVAGESGGSRFECNEKACGRVLKPSEILEIALTPKPANPHATTIDFHEASNRIAKSDDGSIRFTEFHVHQSEGECPILRLRRVLKDCGIDAHAREDGVFVPFAKADCELRPLGLYGEPVEGGMVLKERDMVLKSLYKEGVEKGSLSPEGRFSTTDLRFFAKASEMGFVERKDGVYVLSDRDIPIMKSKGVDKAERDKARNNLNVNSQKTLDGSTLDRTPRGVEAQPTWVASDKRKKAKLAEGLDGENQDSSDVSGHCAMGAPDDSY